MPTEEEIIIRNGTWKQFLNYYVVFGGSASGEYGQTGGIRIKGKYFLIAACALGILLGAVFG